MKPRTKLHREVLDLSNGLPEITPAQETWAYKNCLAHVGYRTKKSISCLDCGYQWNGPQKGKCCTCHSCKTKITITDTRKLKLNQERIAFGTVTIVGRFQVHRIYEIYSYHKAGYRPRRYISEVVRQFILPDNKLTVVAMNRTINHYMDSFNGRLEIRNHNPNYWTNNKYDIYVNRIYPRFKCFPHLKKHGFSSKVMDVKLFQLIQSLPLDSVAETLIKAKQFALFSARIGGKYSEVSRFWGSIKICMRNSYVIKDATTWLDYMDHQRFFGKDLLSPKYTCPKNLEKEHNRLVKKKREVLEKKDQEEKRKKALKNQQDYFEAKQKFFGLLFVDGPLTVKVLENVSEFIEESDAHRHCVFTGGYYNKKDSLIFSAKINGKPVETVEVSLKDFKIIQSRGFGNKASEYNQQIIDLVKSNMHQIRRRLKQTKQAA